MHAESLSRGTFESTSATEFPLSEAVILDRLDENLHFGRAWHRYQYCYRLTGSKGLKILDAGCGTGRAAVEAARLNPWSTVVGVDPSAAALEFAGDRAEAAGLFENIAFIQHDLGQSLPASLGTFDFIVCRGGLARAEDPEKLFATMAGALAPEGLLYVTLASRSGRVTSRALRQAVDAIVPATAAECREERFRVGLELVQSLHADHPIRVRIADAGQEGDAERFVADCLADGRDWTYSEAESLCAGAGLRILYLATPWRWRPDRVFAPDTFSDPLRDRLDRLEPETMGRLIDALDPSLLDGEYRLYACHASHRPDTPIWPVDRLENPQKFDNLIPHLTGLMTPLSAGLDSLNGRFLYRTVSGAIGELDRWSSLLLGAVDGATSCGDIEKSLAQRTRANDNPDARHQRWLDLADGGLVFLQDPTVTKAHVTSLVGGEDGLS